MHNRHCIMTRLPKVGNAGVEHLGLTVLKEIVVAPSPQGLGFLFRELPQFDYGIDAQIEIVSGSADSAVATGKILSVQVKTGKSYFQNESTDGWVNYVSRPTVEYWRAHSVPVLFVIVDPEKREAYWTQGDAEDHPMTEQNCRIEVKRRNRLDFSADFELRSLAENSSEEDRQRALLDSFVPLMAAARRGEQLCMELSQWYNKGSRRTDFYIGVSGSRPDGAHGPPDIYPFSSGSVYQTPSVADAAKIVTPWANPIPDEDFEGTIRSVLYDEYLSECGTYDSEAGGMVDSTGTFERWLRRRRTDSDPRFVAFEDNGEYATFRVALELNDLGKSYLTVKEHLLAPDRLPNWPPE